MGTAVSFLGYADFPFTTSPFLRQVVPWKMFKAVILVVVNDVEEVFDIFLKDVIFFVVSSNNLCHLTFEPKTISINSHFFRSFLRRVCWQMKTQKRGPTSCLLDPPNLSKGHGIFQRKWRKCNAIPMTDPWN